MGHGYRDVVAINGDVGHGYSGDVGDGYRDVVAINGDVVATVECVSLNMRCDN